MAQTSTVQRSIGDSFREVAEFFDRFPSLTAEARYPGIPLVTHFIAARAEQVEAVAKVLDGTPATHVDPITGDTMTRFTVEFGQVQVVVMHTSPMSRELRRPVDVTEYLAGADQ